MDILGNVVRYRHDPLLAERKIAVLDPLVEFFVCHKSTAVAGSRSFRLALASETAGAFFIPLVTQEKPVD